MCDTLFKNYLLLLLFIVVFSSKVLVKCLFAVDVDDGETSSVNTPEAVHTPEACDTPPSEHKKTVDELLQVSTYEIPLISSSF